MERSQTAGTIEAISISENGKKKNSANAENYIKSIFNFLSSAAATFSRNSKDGL